MFFAMQMPNQTGEAQHLTMSLDKDSFEHSIFVFFPDEHRSLLFM